MGKYDLGYLDLKIIAISYIILFLVILQVSNVNAISTVTDRNAKVKIKDYEVRGHVFPIIEESLLEVIMAKLQTVKHNGVLEKMQEEFKNKVQQKISRPTAILALAKASINRNWHYDPSFIQKTDIKDQAGNIIVKAGTNVNPLEKISWGEPLIFIDGDDEQQVKWSKSQIGKLVLTKGNPIELGQELNKQIFFDQGGVFTTRFKIKAVPAVIEQEGILLKISEIKIN
ncbi:MULTISPECIES: type-F conjugative transfer system protein TraW [spotted fever group]|uniref:Conjugal transfer pilus assembly protein TraW n=1 Tax=Rickettsia tamurae subsp. buchneri TaxID=1462938 RepID=A0A8E0WM91_9RICK|nr:MULTISPECIES: type-F conjugative transfer system protein TraW [spotted fever group]EER21664.1 type-F conjugative transfer system protein TraW [Rickettsia endosymbiont of Ixodes scapularis]KDO03225.1 conjugal transfer pilus assembly protein TraW [Rickettsia tamurae subsp. buchneri]